MLVHEDDNGKIYGSDYFILLNRRYKEDPTYVCQADESSDSGSECSDDDEYDDNDFEDDAVSLVETYKADLCN